MVVKMCSHGLVPVTSINTGCSRSPRKERQSPTGKPIMLTADHVLIHNQILESEVNNLVAKVKEGDLPQEQLLGFLTVALPRPKLPDLFRISSKLSTHKKEQWARKQSPSLLHHLQGQERNPANHHRFHRNQI